MTISEEINQFVAENGGNEHDALNVALAKIKALQGVLDLTRQEIEGIDIPSEALGCGIEDNNIRDRYEAARYGFNLAHEKAVECLPD